MKIKKNGDNLEINIIVPLTITGSYTYGEGEWTAPAVIVGISEKMGEYALFYTQFLDYKDSLQATMPIAYFKDKKEALKAAEEFGLQVQYLNY